MPADGEADIDGTPRVNGARVDIGAGEATICGDGICREAADAAPAARNDGAGFKDKSD